MNIKYLLKSLPKVLEKTCYQKIRTYSVIIIFLFSNTFPESSVIFTR